MNRGIVWLTEDDVANLLYIPGTQRIVGLVAKPERACIGVLVEGEGLPPVAYRAEAPTLPMSPYVDLALRAKLEALIKRYDTDEWRELVEMVRRVLSGDLDPRTGVPPPR